MGLEPSLPVGMQSPESTFIPLDQTLTHNCFSKRVILDVHSGGLHRSVKLDLFLNGTGTFPPDPICVIFFLNKQRTVPNAPRTVSRVQKGPWKNRPVTVRIRE
jgi:hypothetical protein